MKKTNNDKESSEESSALFWAVGFVIIFGLCALDAQFFARPETQPPPEIRRAGAEPARVIKIIETIKVVEVASPHAISAVMEGLERIEKLEKKIGELEKGKVELEDDVEFVTRELINTYNDKIDLQEEILKRELEKGRTHRRKMF